MKRDPGSLFRRSDVPFVYRRQLPGEEVQVRLTCTLYLQRVHLFIFANAGFHFTTTHSMRRHSAFGFSFEPSPRR